MAQYKLPPIPYGYRKVKYEIINKSHPKSIVIYVMYVGEMIYIGRANSFHSRINGHRSSENAGLGRYLFGRKDAGKIANIKIVKHLAENVHIETVFVDILQLCETVTESKVAERQWVKACHHTGFHDLLLNIDTFGFIQETYHDLYSMGLMEPDCNI